MEEYDKQIFARNLKRYLSASGKTPADICELLHVSKSTVSSWCTAKKIPRMDKIEIMANYLGIKKSDLIEDKQESSSHLATLSDLQYTLFNETEGVSDETMKSIIQFARFAIKDMEKKQKEETK